MRSLLILIATSIQFVGLSQSSKSDLNGLWINVNRKALIYEENGTEMLNTVGMDYCFHGNEFSYLTYPYESRFGRQQYEIKNDTIIIISKKDGKRTKYTHWFSGDTLIIHDFDRSRLRTDDMSMYEKTWDYLVRINPDSNVVNALKKYNFSTKCLIYELKLNGITEPGNHLWYSEDQAMFMHVPRTIKFSENSFMGYELIDNLIVNKQTGEKIIRIVESNWWPYTTQTVMGEISFTFIKGPWKDKYWFRFGGQIPRFSMNE